MTKMQISKTKKQNDPAKNPLESVRDIGGGMLDQFFGGSDDYEDGGMAAELYSRKEMPKTQTAKKEVKVFNYQEYYESTLIRKQIQELTEAIKKEIEMLKKSDASLINDVRDIENLTINSLPEKPGLYHIRFLELVLNVLRALRAKVGESKTWLQALISKKKKRGSLFAVRSKKQGTQYSMSQELSNSRSVQ